MYYCMHALQRHKNVVPFSTIKQQWNFWMGIIYYVKMNFYTIPTPVLQFLFFSIIALYFLKWLAPLNSLLPYFPKTRLISMFKTSQTFFSFCILIGKSFNGNWLYRGIRGRNFICIVSGAYHGQTKQQDLLFDFVEYRISDIKMTFLNFSPFAKELICHTCLKLYFCNGFQSFDLGKS